MGAIYKFVYTSSLCTSTSAWLFVKVDISNKKSHEEKKNCLPSTIYYNNQLMQFKDQ